MLNRFIQRAPEHFLSRDQIHEVRAGRRGFLAGAFAAAAAAAGHAQAQATAAEGDANILTLPPHSKGLGQPVAARGYGLPSCLLYTSPSPRDRQKSRMPSSA